MRDNQMLHGSMGGKGRFHAVAISNGHSRTHSSHTHTHARCCTFANILMLFAVVSCIALIARVYMLRVDQKLRADEAPWSHPFEASAGRRPIPIPPAVSHTRTQQAATSRGDEAGLLDNLPDGEKGETWLVHTPKQASAHGWNADTQGQSAKPVVGIPAAPSRTGKTGAAIADRQGREPGDAAIDQLSKEEPAGGAQAVQEGGRKCKSPSAWEGPCTDGDTQAGAQPLPLLVIGIPTVARADPDTHDYLPRTLDYVLSQTIHAQRGVQQAADLPASLLDAVPGSDVPGPYPLRVRLVVLDNSRRPGAHEGWARAKARWCPAHGCRKHGLTAPGGQSVADLHTFEGEQGRDLLQSMVVLATNMEARVNDGDDVGDPNTPGAKVRAQTRDVVSLMRVVTALYGEPEDVAELRKQGYSVTPPAAYWSAARADAPSNGVYYMFMEDDFRLCPQALPGLAYLLAKAAYVHPNWNAIRVSYGLNGAIIRMRDQPALGAYFAEHVARRPPDHLTVEWFAGEKPQSAARKAGRPHLAFRYNVLEHFGYKSSLRSALSPAYAFCYDIMDESVVFEVEAFRRQMCEHDDISPCLLPDDPRAPAQPQTEISFVRLAARSRHDTVQTWRKRDAAGNG